MSSKVQWIREVSQEISRSQASLYRAIRDTGRKIRSKYDVLLAYAEWSVPKLKDVEKQEATYQRRIKDLEDLLYESSSTQARMKNEFDEQIERKNQLIDTQNQTIAEQDQTIAEQARNIAKMEELLRSLPLAMGQ
ncbi:hypothetical protein [Limnospira fusiformis]|uniref:hypothetical protein n=1 Tax=Limnospira fusiformis TaxID=54297 RepID=UPI001449D12C|nr:hypothetical protein HFV01_00845 [Limnospira fusiformis SAG 85.79]